MNEARAVQLRAFFALCERDLWVTVRHEPVAFLSQALLQPIFFLFVFGRVLPEIGAAGRQYGTTLLPGIMALTLVLTALQNTALPLVIEFSFTQGDRGPPAGAAAHGLGGGAQKMVIAALRGIVAAILILPLGELILPGGVNLDSAQLDRADRGLAGGLDRRRGDGAAAGHRGAAEPHQRRLRHRADPADLHRRDLLPVAGAERPAAGSRC